MVSTLDFESSDPGSNPALWTLNPAIRVQFPRELNDWMSVDDVCGRSMDCWSGCSYGVMVSTLDFESSDPGSNPALWTLNPATGFKCTLDSESSDPGSIPALWTLNPAIRVQIPVGARFSLWTLNPAIRVQFPHLDEQRRVKGRSRFGGQTGVGSNLRGEDSLSLKSVDDLEGW
ncbi:unnamed protein product [Peronospora belbahrii]|uniref:Uncharacterized protein n=1 Tax=Peronospora belbahrii TaxID=622444 RepID=A0AAU9LH69_9STRA|nr:unnamed protein product [Peronospora belbahrii]